MNPPNVIDVDLIDDVNIVSNNSLWSQDNVIDVDLLNIINDNSASDLEGFQVVDIVRKSNEETYGLTHTLDLSLYESDNEEFKHFVFSLIDEINLDIQAVFSVVNAMLFNSHITNTKVEWSKRMTSCAGICYGKADSCIIRLSEKLLQFRSTMDVITTLVHEMIHAYLFRTHTFDDDSHGSKFHQWMNVINNTTCLNVTVYHHFIQEYNSLKVHVWRCNGKCREQPPYYGYLKRSMNRAPGPHDHWYKEHQEKCGGQFIKIQGPKEPNTKKNEKKPKKSSSLNQNTSL
ncbi:SprT-like domain-containing protein [Entamoeba marina]